MSWRIPGRLAAGAMFCTCLIAASTGFDGVWQGEAESLASAVPISDRPSLYGMFLTAQEAWGEELLPHDLVRTPRLAPEQLCQVLAAQWNAVAVTLKQSPDTVCSWMASYPGQEDAIARQGEAPSIFVVERSEEDDLKSLRFKLNASDDLRSGFAAIALMNRQAHALIGWAVPDQIDGALASGAEFDMAVGGIGYSMKREQSADRRYNFIISPSGACDRSLDAARFVVQPRGGCPHPASITLHAAAAVEN